MNKLIKEEFFVADPYKMVCTVMRGNDEIVIYSFFVLDKSFMFMGSFLVGLN